MPPDLLTDHVVEVGGSVLHPGERIAGVVRGAVIHVRGGALRLLIDAFGLLAGLGGGVVDRLAALLHLGLEIRIRHRSLRKVAVPWGNSSGSKELHGVRPRVPDRQSRGSASNPPQSVLWSRRRTLPGWTT